ncbi:MAG: glycosyltransferase family 2 protein [Verrucomicrobiota bacterium]|nr:glycosyltransferase family 2 protein [Verrucomicrobiota bacterium]
MINASAQPPKSRRAAPPSRIGIIIPACNEEACIARVLQELLEVVDPARYRVAVGVNSSTDRTAAIARQFPVVVAETEARGYGYGCAAAIEALNASEPGITAYLFFAGDGASEPRDLAPLAHAYDQGYAMVLGARTTRRSNWPVMGFSHVLANLSLGIWAGLLGGRWFRDLGPVRLIDRRLFEMIAPREMTFGWTIEAQIAAAMLRAEIVELPAAERPRLAGEQKVSGVNWRRTFSIGCRIAAAGWRTRRRLARRSKTAEQAIEFHAQTRQA